MLVLILQISLVIFSLAIVGNLFRLLKGPSMPDRIIALDAIGINLLAVVAIISVLIKSTVFMDVILLIGILAFLGTTAFARFLERGEVIEYDPHHRDDG